MYGSFVFSSSFRDELPERGRGDSAWVSITPSFSETTAVVHERVTRPGCNHRRRKVRRDHAFFLSQNVANGALRPSPHLIPLADRMMPP